MANGNETIRTNSSLLKGLQIMELVAKESNGVKLSEIADHIGIPRSNATLFINSLLVAGYVLKNPIDKKYYATDKMAKIAKHTEKTKYLLLENAARNPMQTLYETKNENVLLGVMNDYNLCFLQVIYSTKHVQIRNVTNRTYIPHVTAAGKAILAHLNTSLLNSYINQTEFHRYTDHTITDPSELIKELQKVRERGYAYNIGDLEEVIMAVAAPIFHKDEVVAAIVLQLPTFRHTEEDIFNSAADVIQAADMTTQNLKSASTVIEIK